MITSDDITPFIGITGTPVIDVSSSTLYVVAKTRTTAINPVYYQRLYALDLATGLAENSTQRSSNRDSLLPLSPRLARCSKINELPCSSTTRLFTSRSDRITTQGDYHGWLLGYDSATMQQVLIFDVTPNLKHGGIWQSGGGPSADLNHNVYVATGNGPFDADRGGLSYSESFLRLSAAGTLAVADYFTPCDQATLSHNGAGCWIERSAAAAGFRRLCFSTALDDWRREEWLSLSTQPG